MDWTIVIAAGPSLTRADCDALRGVGKTICVNCAVWRAPWADYLYAADENWWKYYGPKCAWFKGQKASRHYRAPGVEIWRGKGWGRTGGNGGHQSIQGAVDKGARNVGIIGFDHQHTNGKTHYHGDHPRNETVRLGNAHNTDHWIKAMNLTAIDLERRGVRVVNLSRETALTCFPRMTVEKFLEAEF